jgi:hypothetical protein
MPDDLLAQRFRELERMTILPEVSYADRLNIRRTFMAGAAAVFDAMLEGVDEHGDMKRPEVVGKRIDSMISELHTFDREFHEGLV